MVHFNEGGQPDLTELNVSKQLSQMSLASSLLA
jgi:hypothetical protein